MLYFTTCRTPSMQETDVLFSKYVIFRKKISSIIFIETFGSICGTLKNTFNLCSPLSFSTYCSILKTLDETSPTRSNTEAYISAFKSITIMTLCNVLPPPLYKFISISTDITEFLCQGSTHKKSKILLEYIVRRTFGCSSSSFDIFSAGFCCKYAITASKIAKIIPAIPIIDPTSKALTSRSGARPH